MAQRTTLAAALLVTISAPAAADIDPFDSAAFASINVGTLPTAGVERTVTAGEPIVATFVERVSPGAEIIDKAESPAKFDPPVVFEPGTRFYKAKTSKAFKGCATTPGASGWAVCMIDDDGDGTFDRMAWNDVASAQPMASRVRYRLVPEVRFPAASGASSKVILYQGATSDTLRLSYREFTAADMARPAFTEEIAIPLEKEFPQQVAIKGVLLTVSKINGLGIKYRVDKIEIGKGWPGF